MNRLNLKIICVAAFVLSLIGVGMTVAYLANRTQEIRNVFTSPTLELEIKEEFDGVQKEEVAIVATGDIAQYIRVRFACSLQDEQGNTLALPISIDDFTIEGLETLQWMQQGGTYYYKNIVLPGQEISVFDRATVKTSFPEGQIPVFTIIAEGIQTNAAQTQWGVILENDVIVGGGM